MGGTHSKKYGSTPKEMKFVMLGPGSSGRTSFMYRLKHGVPPKDYAYMDYETFDIDGITLHALDYTGRGHYDRLTQLYYMGANGMIFMIDSAFPDRFDYALEILNIALTDEKIHSMTIMVVANKQDLDDAVGPEVIEEMIRKECTIGKGISLFVMPMSVTTEDDHSMKLGYRLFCKTMKRKEQGKVPSGLIPRAWETAEKVAEDSDCEHDIDDDCDDDGDEKDVDDKNDAIKAKEKKMNMCFPVGKSKKTKSLFRDPVHMFKSLLIR